MRCFVDMTPDTFEAANIISPFKVVSRFEIDQSENRQYDKSQKYIFICNAQIEIRLRFI